MHGASTDTEGSSTVQWSGLQNILEHAESDVLVLLDCCAAASWTSGAGSGVTEIIAACGFESWAPGVGEHSFTRSLIDELKYWARSHTLSVALLHNKVLSRIKYWKPRFGAIGDNERRKTPVYIVIANEGRQRSIELRPLKPEAPIIMEPPTTQKQNSHSGSSSSSGTDSIIIDEDVSMSSQSSLELVWLDPDFCSPKALISLALKEDQYLRIDDWVDWLRSVPALVKYARVDGKYKSGSPLLLLTIPIVIWDLLPADPAINFVGFVNSHNLIQERRPSVSNAIFSASRTLLSKSSAKINAEKLAPKNEAEYADMFYPSADLNQVAKSVAGANESDSTYVSEYSRLL